MIDLWGFCGGNPFAVNPQVIEKLVRPGRFERPTFCSGGNVTTSKLLIRWTHWDHFSTSPDCLSEKLLGKLLG